MASHFNGQSLCACVDVRRKYTNKQNLLTVRFLGLLLFDRTAVNERAVV